MASLIHKCFHSPHTTLTHQFNPLSFQVLEQSVASLPPSLHSAKQLLFPSPRASTAAPCPRVSTAPWPSSSVLCQHPSFTVHPSHAVWGLGHSAYTAPLTTWWAGGVKKPLLNEHMCMRLTTSYLSRPWGRWVEY